MLRVQTREPAKSFKASGNIRDPVPSSNSMPALTFSAACRALINSEDAIIQNRITEIITHDRFNRRGAKGRRDWRSGISAFLRASAVILHTPKIFPACEEIRLLQWKEREDVEQSSFTPGGWATFSASAPTSCCLASRLRAFAVQSPGFRSAALHPQIWCRLFPALLCFPQNANAFAVQHRQSQPGRSMASS